MSAYAQQVLLDSPVGFWPLDRVNTLDLSGNGRHLATTEGTPTAHSDLAPSTLFSGSGQSLYTAAATALAPSGDLSWEIWAKKTSGTGLYSVFGAASSGNPLPWGFDTAGNVWRAFLGDSAGNAAQLAVDPTTIVNGRWYHLAATLNGTTISLYVNGAVVASNSTVSSTRVSNGATARNVFVGRYNLSFSQYFPGALFGAAFYGSALSAARVQAHYQAGIRGGVSY